MINIITNRISNKNYNFSFKKINNNIRICLFSDMHISKTFNMNNLAKIKSTIDNNKPDYIFIVGDIIDSLDIFTDDKINIFYKWLDNLGNVNNKRIPVIVILGNHDYYSYDRYKFDKYSDSLNKLNIHLLDDSIYEDKYIRVVGFNTPSSAYHSKDSFSNLRKYINKLDKNLFNISNNKINMALIHNPMFVINNDSKDKFNSFDLVFSGHMHNGLMLPFMEKIIRGNLGIISPDKKLLPKVSRNDIKINTNNYLIISGGITKLSRSAKVLNKFNIIYPMEITNINIKD